MAGAVAGGPFGGAVRTATGAGQLALSKDEVKQETTTPSDEEIADVITNAPTDELAAQIALEASEDTEFDTSVPEVEEDTFDIDNELSEAPEVEDKLPQTLAPKGKGFFESQQEAQAYKNKNLEKQSDPQFISEMETMQPVERIPGQWVLEKQTVAESQLQPTGKDDSVETQELKEEQVKRVKRVKEMTPDEMRDALLTSELIPELGSKRAYQEAVDYKEDGVFLF